MIQLIIDKYLILDFIEKFLLERAFLTEINSYVKFLHFFLP